MATGRARRLGSGDEWQMVDAVMNVAVGSAGAALALLGPWPHDSWWPARILWGIAVFNIALGIVTLVAVL